MIACLLLIIQHQIKKIACLLLIIQHQIKKIACLLLIIQLVNPDMQRLASTRCAQKSTSPSTPYCAEESERKS